MVDSDIVVRYIRNESRRFHVFVANRVGIIRSLNDPEQWRHISGKENPADLITRGMTPEQLKSSMWFSGPKFLKLHKSKWQSDSSDYVLSEDDPEVKTDKSSVVVHVTDVDFDYHPLSKLIDYFSGWSKLKKALSWLIRIRDHLRKKNVSKSRITPQEMSAAEVVLLKYSQNQYYASEIHCLSNGTSVKKSSPLKSLSPVLNEDSVLCVGGRLKHADINVNSKHPCIIPFQSPLAKMIVLEMHSVAHLGVEWVLSLIRKKFWIIKARSIIKCVIRKCIICRKLFALPCKQQMSDLPPDRLSPFKPPFSMIGLDCFGPLC